MQVFELVLLILAYTTIVMALFLELICYSRKIETLETILLTASLLLLIISLSFNYFPQKDGYQNQFASVLIPLAMIAVSITTVFNVLEERKHSIKVSIKKINLIISMVLICLVITDIFLDFDVFSEYIVATYLCLNIVFSMLLIRKTKPVARIAHREQIERVMSVSIMVVIPLSLLLNYMAQAYGFQLTIGFTVPMILTLVAGSKVWDDMQRLALVKQLKAPQEQHFQNYQLTAREREIATLLLKGNTYNDIAEQLFISVPTVKTHVSNIYKKCQVKNRTELINLLTN